MVKIKVLTRVISNIYISLIPKQNAIELYIEDGLRLIDKDFHYRGGLKGLFPSILPLKSGN